MRSTSAPAWIALAALFAAGPSRAAEAAPVLQMAPDALEAQRLRLQGAMEASAKAESDRRSHEGALDGIRADGLRLSAALIDATARVRDAEGRSAAVEGQLAVLTGREGVLRHSLAGRRSQTAAVLAALRRTGLHPPPAFLLSPNDMTRAIRASALLGSVVSGLRAAAGALASDLAELGTLRVRIAGQRDALVAQAAALGGERARLSALVAARQAAAEGALAGEREREAALAREATGLQDLVSRLEGGVASARRAADDAKRRAAEADAAGVTAKAAAAARNPARLAPSLPFADAKGRLPLPAAGRTVKGLGATDGYGGQERGLSLATHPGAVVTAPADGWISFSGPYRSYGQVAIMTMGDGFHVVLAGLARIDVVPGQFVLAGEPLGAMGDGSVGTAAAIALGAGEPVLYVEFRKDGAAIDPAPWWAKAELQKVRG